MFHIVTVKADKEEEEQTKFQQMQAELEQRHAEELSVTEQDIGIISLCNLIDVDVLIHRSGQRQVT